MWLTEVDNWWYKPNISLCLFCLSNWLYTRTTCKYHIVWIYIMVGYTRSAVNCILIITSSLFQWTYIDIYIYVVAEPDNAIKKRMKNPKHLYACYGVNTFASAVFEWNILLEHDMLIWEKSNIGCPIWQIPKQHLFSVTYDNFFPHHRCLLMF